jgi:hypothetical protein
MLWSTKHHKQQKEKCISTSSKHKSRTVDEDFKGVLKLLPK